jgi:hypothetical protein
MMPREGCEEDQGTEFVYTFVRCPGEVIPDSFPLFTGNVRSSFQQAYNP